MTSGILAVFDFDHTIIESNSDVVLRDLLPADILQEKKLKGLRPSWTAYMAEVFRLLPQHGIDKERVLKTCRHLPSSQGIINLFHYLEEIAADTMILSDANSEIIATWVDHNLSLRPLVVTNPAVWGQDGVLKVKPYHQQTSCKQCPINLCKGAVLNKYLEDKSYKLVVYTGDGKNDLCPAQKLRATDLVCARANYALEGLLNKSPVQAQSCIWTSGSQIRSEIERITAALWPS